MNDSLSPAQRAKRRYAERYPERVALAKRRYYERNKEKVKARAAQWTKETGYKKPKEGIRARARKYWATNPVYRLRHANKEAARRAAKRGCLSEKVDRLKVWAMHNGICGICKQPVDINNFHLDHIVPLARNGSHSYANTQPTHPRCNLTKGAH